MLFDLLLFAMALLPLIAMQMVTHPSLGTDCQAPKK